MQTHKERDRHISEELRMEAKECVFLSPESLECISLSSVMDFVFF